MRRLISRRVSAEIWRRKLRVFRKLLRRVARIQDDDPEGRAVRRRGGRVGGGVQRHPAPPVPVVHSGGTPGIRQSVERGDARDGVAVFVRVGNLLRHVKARGERGLRRQEADVHARLRVFAERVDLRGARQVAGGGARRHAARDVPAAGGRRDSTRRRHVGREKRFFVRRRLTKNRAFVASRAKEKAQAAPPRGLARENREGAGEGREG
mmetsp:Transcript_1247/g.5020  ORF Transcript_1247/g.5020 Transcript_1247/m.5020 type:complete len:209 (-) Transcript_1247:490-1116(-)